jgi:hypothetical protein
MLLVTVVNVRNCKTVVSIVILYIIILRDHRHIWYMQTIVDRNISMQRMTVKVMVYHQQSHVLYGNIQSKKIYNCHSYFVIRMKIGPFDTVELEVLFPYYILRQCFM